MAMLKYDEFGFLNKEWASSNIQGFDELGSCCQQLLILFPDVPHNCADVIKEEPTPLPMFDLPDGTETYGGGGGVSGYGPAAGAMVVGGLLLPDDGGSSYKPPVSVDEPFTGILMATSLIAVAICKKFGILV